MSRPHTRTLVVVDLAIAGMGLYLLVRAMDNTLPADIGWPIAVIGWSCVSFVALRYAR